MGFEPTQADLVAWAVQRFKHTVTLSDQRSSVGELIQTNKSLKQRCSVSNIMFFWLKTNKPIKSSHWLIKNRLDLLCLKCNDEYSTIVLEQD